MNYTTGACGHPVVAVGFEGSAERKRCESRLCTKCRYAEQIADGPDYEPSDYFDHVRASYDDGYKR